MIVEHRRSFLGRLALGASLPMAASLAMAQAYPARPVRLIVPWPPGGVTDILGRAVAPEMAKHLGQSIVIENKPGAAGKLGTELAAHAVADGYTIYLANNATFSVAAAWEDKLRYDPLKDFAAVGLISDVPAIMAVRSSLSVRDMQELISLARSQPGRLTFASAGEGSAFHLYGELFKAQAGVELLHVPFQGSAPATQAVVAGQVDIIFDSAGLKPYMESGQVRALAVDGPDRSFFVPNVKTMKEQGIPNFDRRGWMGIFAPAGTPANVIAQLNGALNKALDSDAVSEILKTNGFSKRGGSPAALQQHLVGDMAYWKGIVSSAKPRPR